MAQLPYHPAPGLGDMLPGWFDVPQNPITAQRGVTVVPGIGDILPGSFVVPQNPILDYARGHVQPLATASGVPGGVNAPKGVGHVGCGCGCSGGCSHGLGDISTDWNAMWSDLFSGNFAQAGTDFGNFLSDPTIGGIPVWAFGIGVFFLIRMVFSHEVTVGARKGGGRRGGGGGGRRRGGFGPPPMDYGF